MRCSLLHSVSPGAHVTQLIMVLGNPPQQLRSDGPASTSEGAATQALRWALALLTGGGWRLMHATCSRCLAGRSTWRGVPPTAPGAPMPGCEAMHGQSMALHSTCVWRAAESGCEQLPLQWQRPLRPQCKAVSSQCKEARELENSCHMSYVRHRRC